MKIKDSFISSSIFILLLVSPPVQAGIFGLPNIPTSIPGLGNLSDLNKLAELLGQDDASSLIDQLTDYINQINSGSILKTALSDLMNEPQFAPLKEVILASVGQSGIPDPAKAQASLLAALKALPVKRTVGSITPTIAVDGQLSSGIAKIVTQGILGTEAQARLSKVIQGISKSIGQVATLSASSNTSAQASNGFVDMSRELANNSAENASYSSTSQDAIQASATESQSLTSTQDVLKKMADQNGQSGSILANISSQLSNASNQNYAIANQLGNVSNQNSYAAQQSAQRAIIAGESLQIQKQLLEAQAATLDSQNTTNSFLAQKQKELPLEITSIISERNPIVPSR